MRFHTRTRCFVYSVLIVVTVLPQLHSQGSSHDDVTIIRDSWGIPHIYSDDEWSLFYGAGYAAAQDRLLQMAIARYSVQGRMSEIFGQRYLDHDRLLRTLGLYSHAQQSLSSLNDTTRLLLEAYAAGVNAYMTDNPDHLATIFRLYGGLPEPWSAADCIACFLRISRYFDGGWKSEVQALRKFEPMADTLGREAAIRELERQRRIVDEEVVIVSREEYDRYPKKFTELLRGQTIVSSGSGMLSKGGMDDETWEAPKMSHNWVVGGSKSSTGLPILESDPQIAVESPSTWYEFHLSGGRFNVRGIGMPGAPGMLIGFSDYCAWGLTALGSDNADLFQEQYRPGSRTEYKWKDNWETIQEESETIRIKGSREESFTVRSTRHGPIVNDFVNGEKQDELFALHWLMIEEPSSDLEGLLGMMTATNWPTFTAGMRKYRSPGVHLIYADKGNNIAYYTLARLPLREHTAGIPFRGWTGDEEWKGTIPFDEMPRMLNPLQGFISTANNAPIGSWYPHNVGGGLGDNARSWRLRELMTGQATFTPEDFFDVHRDAVNPIVRDFVRFALIAVDEENPRDPDIQAAATLLRGWDYKLLTSSPTYRMTSQIGTIIKRSLRNTPLESRYLGSDAGLSQLFRDVGEYFDSTGQLTPDPDIRAWLLTRLGEAYRVSGAGNGGRPVIVTHNMPYQDNLENLGSLAAAHDMTSPALSCGVVATIWSQLGNSYSQIVNFAEIDSSFSILPPGISEVPENRHFKDQIPMWVAGDMHLAPLSRPAIERIEESRKVLDPDPTGIHGTGQVPGNPKIHGIYPSPFTERAVILYELDRSAIVRIDVYDVLGKRVFSADPGYKTGGLHSQSWSGMGLNGKLVPAGTYSFRITTDRLSTGISAVKAR